MVPPTTTSTAEPRTDSAAGAARKQDNEYIPSFISKAPFYLDTGESEDSLQHQRSSNIEQYTLSSGKAWAESRRPRKAGPAATKFRKGACENCGAMGHKKKSCLERPRKIGAKYSGRDIQADRVLDGEEEMNGAGHGGPGWEAKRDVYNGYDPKQFKEVVEEYEIREEARKEAQAEAAAKAKGQEEEDEENGYEGGFKYADESEIGRDRTIKQSIRIREDTAKYLLNLDPESAKYNPKKRALVDAGAVNDKSAQMFAEENFMRGTGEAGEFEKAQRYAWELQEKTGDTSLHMQANPTAGAVLAKKEQEERERKRQKRAEMLASQYGEQQTIPEAIREMALAQKEEFVEYDEAGLIKGAPEKAAKSKYAEDVFINNHTSVWGSWWSDFKWGYACCHSFVKASYCTGEVGRQAKEKADNWDK